MRPRVRLRERGRAALRSFVRSAGDRRLERTVASDVALAVLLRALAARFDPDAADGFEGDLQLDLRSSAGDVRAWTIAVRGRRARVRRGAGKAPALVVKIARADLVRLATGELDAGRALLSGRLDLEGDAAVAFRVGPMFGAPTPF